MTIFNAAAFLQDSIDSLLAQSYPDWELIAVENGSQDASPQILSQCADPRVRTFLLEENIGRTPALRHAFLQARGEYVAVLDADDIAYPRRLEKQVAFLDKHPAVVLVGAWADYIDEYGTVIGESMPPTDPQSLYDLMGSGNPFIHSAAMYRTSDAAAAGGYPEEIPYAQDFGLWLRLAKRGGLEMIGEKLCKFRIVSHSLTRGRQFRVDVTRDQLVLLMRARQVLSLSNCARQRSREEITIARLRYGVALLQTRHVLRGIGELGVAALRDPISIFRNRVVRDFLVR